MAANRNDLGNNSTNRKIALGLAVIISAAWAISFMVDIVDQRYDPPASVHALMLLVAGAVFGEGLLRSTKPLPPKEKEDDA